MRADGVCNPAPDTVMLPGSPNSAIVTVQDAMPAGLSGDSMACVDAGAIPMGDPKMKLLRVLALATAMAGMAGCMTVPGYSYRGGSGDYYYGYPSVDYNRHYRYGGYYSPYSSPYYRYGSGVSLRYRYGYPRYPYYRQRPDHDGHHAGGGHDDNADQPSRATDARPPWRNLERQYPRQSADGGSRPGQRPRTDTPVRLPRPSATRRPATQDAGTTRMIRRARSVRDELRNKKNEIAP